MSSLDLSQPPSPNDLTGSPGTVSFASLLTPAVSEETTENKRQLRRRSTDDSHLHRINRRVITKPKKNFSSLGLGGSESEIKKIYMCKKLTKVKSTCLETIFEENDEDASSSATKDDASSCVKLIGVKKLKRRLSCSDGMKPNKVTAKKRKGRIIKFLGKSQKSPKISMEFFLNKLRAMHGDEQVPAEVAMIQATSDSECVAD